MDMKVGGCKEDGVLRHSFVVWLAGEHSLRSFGGAKSAGDDVRGRLGQERAGRWIR